jgi:hypothetical protein
MKTEKELQIIIKKILTEKTFSVDALSAIKDLDKEHTSLLKEHEDTKETVEIQAKQIKELLTEISKYTGLESEVRLRELMVKTKESELIDRENKLQLKELRADLTEAFSSATVNNLKEFVSLVFRNTQVRKSVNSYTNEPIVNNGYACGVANKNAGETTTIEEE